MGFDGLINRAGIDLGTTNSAIYAVVGDDIVPIPFALGDRTAPSVVWKSGDTVLVGRDALAKAGASPPPIFEIKSLMGTDATVLLDGEPKSPVEISAMILRYLREQAEQYLRKTYPEATVHLTDVVITHPARFSGAATQATRAAGLHPMTGFTNVTLQAEPNAAVLAYDARLGTSRRTEGRYVVYDLGGGTFDISIMERLSDGHIDVTAYDGDPQLGGEMFDRRLAEHLRAHLIQQDYALENLNPSDPDDHERLLRLKQEAESIKIEFGSRPVVTRSIPRFLTDKRGQIVRLDITVEKSKFEELCQEELARTIRYTHKLLAQQAFAFEDTLSAEQAEQLIAEGRRGLTDEELRQYPVPPVIRERSRANAQHVEVLMAGGSCRMKMVARALETELGTKPTLIDPDLIVAEGAGVLARTLHADEFEVTADPQIRIKVTYPRETNRLRQVPIAMEIDGPARGCHFTLLDCESGQVDTKPVSIQHRVLFHKDLYPNQSTEFLLEMMKSPSGPSLYRRTLTIRHNPQFTAPMPIDPTNPMPLYILTEEGFVVLFAANAPYPVQAKATFETADGASGKIRLPFYEGDQYIDEIIITGCPKRAGVPIHVSASMTSDRRVKARAEVEDSTQPAPHITFTIPPRVIRSVDEIQDQLRKLKARFDDVIPSVQIESRKLDLLGAHRELLTEVRRELDSMWPSPVRLESLIAQYTKLIDDVSRRPVLTPSLASLEKDMAERRPFAPSAADAELLDESLEKAREAWKQADRPSYEAAHGECYTLTDDWNRVPAPDEETLRHRVKQCLAVVTRTINEDWDREMRRERAALIKEIAEAGSGKHRDELEKTIPEYEAEVQAQKEALRKSVAKLERQLDEATTKPSLITLYNDCIDVKRTAQAGPPKPGRPGFVRPEVTGR